MDTEGNRHAQVPQIGDDLPAGDKSSLRHTQTNALSQEHISPWWLSIILALSVFFAELLAMILSYELPQLPEKYLVFIDAGIMMVLISSVLYFLSSRPLIRSIVSRAIPQTSMMNIEKIKTGIHRTDKQMKTQANWMLVVLSSALFLAAFALSACARQMESITIAYSPFESTALLWIADDQQFLVQNGLNVTMRKYDSGVGALDGMMNGEADLALGANEFPLVGKAFQKAEIRTIGSIARSEFIYLVGRRDRGIEEVVDLKRKKVGTTFKTIAEFHLGRLLELHGMSMQDIIPVDVRTPEAWVNAVANGDVDAIVTAQPYANIARDQLGANAVMWPAQSHQPLYTQVIANQEWITQHPELVVRFLKSLYQAEDYLIRKPDESKAIVQKQLNLDPAYMDTVWSQNQFSLSLDQSLVLAMEDEARWMIANNLTSESEVPDFLGYLYLDGLQVVKPEAVNIIR